MKTIFKCRIGSHLYGLNTPESDEDYIGVFIPDTESILGLQHVEIIDKSTKKSSSRRRNTKEDVDYKLFSLHKFLQLLLNNNPNIVEILFANSDNILLEEPEFKFLRDNYDKIVSQKIYYSFSGYAFSQKKYLITKKERYLSLKNAVEYLDSILEERAITQPEADKLNSILKFYKGEKGNTQPFHKGMDIPFIYSRIKYEFDQYGYRVKELNFNAPPEETYDRKFGYHLVRLMVEAVEFLKTGKIKYPIEGKGREDILKVKNGELTLTQVLSLYETYKKKADEAFAKTKLPKKPNFDFINNYLIETYRKNICGEKNE